MLLWPLPRKYHVIWVVSLCLYVGLFASFCCGRIIKRSRNGWRWQQVKTICRRDMKARSRTDVCFGCVQWRCCCAPLNMYVFIIRIYIYIERERERDTISLYNIPCRELTTEFGTPTSELLNRLYFCSATCLWRMCWVLWHNGRLGPQKGFSTAALWLLYLWELWKSSAFIAAAHPVLHGRNLPRLYWDRHLAADFGVRASCAGWSLNQSVSWVKLP